MNIGIIGLGKIGKIRFDILNNYSNVNVSFYDPSVGNYKDKISNSLEQLIDENEAFIVSSPNCYILDYIRKLVDKNKHIFCEKPPGISFNEALEIDGLQYHNPHLKIKFGFNHRYLKNFIALKEALKNEKIYWIRGVYGKGIEPYYFNTWRASKEQAGGGIFIDQGIHMLDLILDIVGELRIEHVMGDSFNENLMSEDNMFVHMRSKTGIPISMHSTLSQWKHTFKLEVSTSTGIYSIDGIKSSTRSYGNEKLIKYVSYKDNFVKTNIQEFNSEDYYTMKDELEEFLSAISDGEVKIGTTKDAVRVMQLIKDIYDCSR